MKARRIWTLAIATLLLLGAPFIQTAEAETLVAWGRDSYGERSETPGGDNFIAVSAGYWHSVALESTGALVAWGDNWHRQCNVPSGNDFVDVSAGAWHTLALRVDGSLAGWGYNNRRQSNVPAGTDFMAIAAGGYHSMALNTNRELVAWGENDDGQCDVPDNGEFVAIAAGGWHGLAVRSDGSLVGWGRNHYGQADVPEGNDFVAVAAGARHSLALRSDGSLVGWGRNHYGQADVPEGNDFVAMDCGEAHSLALTRDGEIIAWGRNNYGQCTISVPDGYGLTAVAAGWVHNLALEAEIVIPTNHEPIAHDQSCDTDEDTPATFALAASDDDGDVLTWHVVTPPLFGSISGAPPELVYTPTTDYFGADALTFQVDDGEAASNVATVNITVHPVNDAPVAVALVNGLESVVVQETTWAGTVVSLDASQSYDPDEEEVILAWDIDEDGVFDSSEPMVNVRYALGGPYVAVVSATDAAGESNTDEVSVTVVAGSISDQLANLKGLIKDCVASGHISPKLETSLMAKVNAVEKTLAKNTPKAVKVAANNLQALANHVRAQRGKKIDPAIADEMLERIDRLIAALTE